VIVETADSPSLTAAGEVALIVKSGALVKVNVAMAECVREPLVPVIVTMKAVATVEVQDRVAPPEPDTVAGVIVPQRRPEAGWLFDRDTVPVKPFWPVTVIVEIAEDPTTLAGELTAIAKSTKLNVAVAVWVSVPLAPVSVTENWPAVVELQDKVADPEPVTLPEEMGLQLRILGTVSVRTTPPENAFKAATVIVEDAVEPT